MANKKAESKTKKATPKVSKDEKQTKQTDKVDEKQEVITAEIKVEVKNEAAKENIVEHKPEVYVKRKYKNVCHGGASFSLDSGQDLSIDPGLIYELKKKGIEFVSDKADCV